MLIMMIHTTKLFELDVGNYIRVKKGSSIHALKTKQKFSGKPTFRRNLLLLKKFAVFSRPY